MPSFLDDAIFPELDKKLNPPQETAEAGEEGEEKGGAGEDGGDEDGEDEA